jgi:hypothetical protein
MPAVQALRPDFTYVTLDHRGQEADFDDAGPWTQAVAGYLKMGGVTP